MNKKKIFGLRYLEKGNNNPVSGQSDIHKLQKTYEKVTTWIITGYSGGFPIIEEVDFWREDFPAFNHLFDEMEL